MINVLDFLASNSVNDIICLC